MKPDKLSLLIFTFALFLVLLPHTLYSFVKKRLEQPKLNIQIELSEESHAKQCWMLEETEDGQSRYIYEIFWRYKLSIKNHSSHTGYNLEIFPNFHLPYYSEIAPITETSVVSSQTITTNGYHSKLHRCKEGEQIEPSTLPKEFDKVKLLLTYQNQHRITFYTVFDVKIGTNSYHRFRPSEFSLSLL